MDIVADVLEELMDAFTRDPDEVVLTGHGCPAAALADVTEYLCHCIFNCADRGSVLSMRIHSIWGSALGRFYATKSSGASYSTAILFAEHAMREMLSSVEEFGSDIDRSNVPLLLEEAVHAFAQVHVPDCESRTRVEAIKGRIEACT